METLVDCVSALYKYGILFGNKGLECVIENINVL